MVGEQPKISIGVRHDLLSNPGVVVLFPTSISVPCLKRIKLHRCTGWS